MFFSGLIFINFDLFILTSDANILFCESFSIDDQPIDLLSSIYPLYFMNELF